MSLDAQDLRSLDFMANIAADAVVAFTAASQDYFLRIRRDQSAAFDETTFMRSEMVDVERTAENLCAYRRGTLQGAGEIFERGDYRRDSAVDLRHVAIGRWETRGPIRQVGNTVAQTKVFRIFTFGNATPVGDLPQSGTVSFDFRATGYAGRPSQEGARYFLGQPAPEGGVIPGLTINFATGDFVGELAHFDACFSGVTTCNRFRLRGKLVPGTSRLEGVIDTIDGYEGSFVGSFFGPGARELGLILYVQGPEGRKLISAVIGNARP